MAGWHLDTKMAQDIVARTMRIIDTNINVMDARGRIIGSGDRERIGELHEGALLVLSQGRVVDIDDAVARHADQFAIFTQILWFTCQANYADNFTFQP